MRKRHRIALAVLVVALVGVVVWQVLCSQEPEPFYHGKPLSAWLEQYYDALENPESPMTGGPTVTGVTADGLGGEESAKQAEAALRTIGTNALPVLLLMAKAHDSALKGEWIRLSFRLSPITYHPRSDFVYRGMAALGFFTLGSDAKPAVPALTRLLSEQYADVRASTARTLGFMGDAAQAARPALVKSLRDKDAQTRLAAAEALKKIDHEAAARVGVR
jgi:HEAT repeat protein